MEPIQNEEQFESFSIYLKFLWTIKQISDILQTGLDKTALRSIISLLELGNSPEAIVSLVKDIMKSNVENGGKIS